jgi:hypothetical protein
MAKKKQEQNSGLQDTIKELRKKYNINKNIGSSDKEYANIVDIITFCNDPQYLNLPNSNFHLFRSQRVVLKCLYMGTRGNENISLDEDEWDWLENKGNCFPEEHKITIQKIKERLSCGVRFSELTLVLGRRSSKTILSSVISCYEIYKLLMIDGGDPYKFYKIPKGQEIAVMNVATSFKQAKRLYAQIQTRIENSPFLRNRVAASSGEEIRIFTDYDLEKRKDPDQKIKNNGSVVIVCGHSNYDSLRGYSAICIIFDELGFYDEAAKISGRAFYDAMSPSVAQFAEAGFDAGLLVEISSPGPKSGVLYKLYQESLDLESRSTLSFRCPTWIFNENMTEQNPILAKSKRTDPDVYDIEYGANWPEGGVFGKYFSPEELVTQCIDLSLSPEEKRSYSKEYYMHVDPGLTDNRYATVIVRREMYRAGGKVAVRVILSYVRVWEPVGKQPLDYLNIDRKILELCGLFKPIVVSYDAWNSVTSVQSLKSRGYNCLQTPFSRSYKCKIYQNLKELMANANKGLVLFDDPFLIPELKELIYKPTQRQISIGANSKSDTPTDDVADCLAGAAFLACGNYYKRLPSSIVANIGLR